MEIVVQSGHYLAINDLEFSSDGSLIATCSPDETVRLWDVRAGCERAVLMGHTGPVYQVRFSYDGSRLYSGGWDKCLRIWDPPARTGLHLLTGITRHPIDAIALSSSGDLVAAGGTGVGKTPSQLLIWEAVSGKVIQSLEIAQSTGCLAFSPDGSLLAVADGNYNRLRVIETDTGKERFLIEGVHPATENNSTSVSLVFSLDSRVLVRSNFEGLQLLDVETGEKLADLSYSTTCRRLEIRAGGILTVFEKECIKLWDLDQRKVRETIPFGASCLSPNGRLLARADGRHLEIIDRSSGQTIRRLGSQLELPERIGNLSRHFALAANPMYPIVATSAPDGMVRVWDLRSVPAPRFIAAHSSMIEALSFDPRGNLLASGAREGLKLWHVRDGTLLHDIPIEGGVKEICFSAQGDRLVVGSRGNRLITLDLQAGNEVASASVESVEAVAYPPFGPEIFAASFRKLLILDTTLSEVGSFEHPLPINALAFNHRGTLAIAGGLSKWFGYSDRGSINSVTSLLEPGKRGFTYHLKGHSSQIQAIAFSPDGDTVVTGGGDGKVIAWSVTSGEERFSIDAHAGDVTGVAFVSDGSFIASIGLDSALRLWEAQSGRLAATLISLNDEDFVVLTDKGYYNATKRGLRSVMFHVKERMLPFEQFDLRLNRPDLVLARLGYALPELVNAYAEIYQQRIRRIGFDPGTEVETTTVPEVVIPDPPVAVSHDRHIRIQVQLHSCGSPLERLQVYCNDVPTYGRSGLDVRFMGQDGALEVEIELSSGDNKLQFYSIDSSGTESQRETFRVFFVTDKSRPKLFVLAIGVSKYDDPQFNLSYAAKDAQDLVQELRYLQRRFVEVKALLLDDKKASRRAILATRSFLEQTQVDDQVIILFAGHGAIENQDYYFLPANFDPSSISTSGISYNEIESLIDGIDARRRLVLLDTCHSGEADNLSTLTKVGSLPLGVRKVRSFRDLAAPEPDPSATAPYKIPTMVRLQDVFADLRQESGAYVIAAAGAEEYAREFQELENGVFTSSVIQALRNANADRNQDGVLTVSKLHRFVIQNVLELTGGRQQPVSRRENLAEDFPII